MDPGRPRLDRRAWLVGLTVFFALGGALPFMDTATLVTALYSHDDCFYYFQIARNLGEGRGFTFDGLHETNGFHPLWLLVLVPLFLVVPGDGPPLFAVALLEVALVTAAAVVVYRVLRRRIAASAALVGALLLVAQPGISRSFRVGMESSLLLLMLALTWRSWLTLPQASPPPPRHALTLGLWCAACFFTRIEAIMVLPAILLLGWRWLRRHPRFVLLLTAPTALCAAGYLAWNRTAFGVWLPISGIIKAEWTNQATLRQRLVSLLRVDWLGERVFREVFGADFLFAGSWGPTALHAVILCVLGWLVWRYRGLVGRAIKRSGAAFVLVSGLLIVAVDRVTVMYVEQWQNGVLFAMSAVLSAALLATAPRAAGAVAACAAAVGLARTPLQLWHTRDAEGHPSYYTVQAAGWLRANTAPSQRVGAWNGGGMLGYFSARPVVILDGLVNDARFLREVIGSGRLEEYLTRERIDLIGDAACSVDTSFEHVLTRNTRRRPTLPLSPDAYQRLRSQFSLETSFFRTGAPDGCPGYSIWRRTAAVP
jgi:hypothetical protein